LENYFFGTCLPNNLTGFKTPDFRKFSEMVVFFIPFFDRNYRPWITTGCHHGIH
jgi:hypothetical protein